MTHASGDIYMKNFPSYSFRRPTAAPKLVRYGDCASPLPPYFGDVWQEGRTIPVPEAPAYSTQLYPLDSRSSTLPSRPPPHGPC